MICDMIIAAQLIITPGHTHVCDQLCLYDTCMATLHPLIDVLDRALRVSCHASLLPICSISVDNDECL
jgi:hypothetical protein